MKTIDEYLAYLKETVQEEEAKKVLKKLAADIDLLGTKSGLSQLLSEKKLAKIVHHVRSEKELKAVQAELIKLQDWVYENNKRVMILFEGRDAAGKGGTIKRFIQYLNPRKFRVAALQKPTEVERGQFYFQRYLGHLPNAGEITFFDRSWYNRAIVEPVFGFCTPQEYEKFMKVVPQFEEALIDDGIILIKFWLDITKEEQQKRFEKRMKNPLKQWKLSSLDQHAHKMWSQATQYKEAMFARTHTEHSPWIIVDSNDKIKTRLEAIRYVLSTIDYDGKKNAPIGLEYDPKIVYPYH